LGYCTPNTYSAVDADENEHSETESKKFIMRNSHERIGGWI